jgi:hypothetical protein
MGTGPPIPLLMYRETIHEYSADYHVSAQWTVSVLGDVYFGARHVINYAGEPAQW